MVVTLLWQPIYAVIALIMPYLTLTDISAFANTSHRSAAKVKEYILAGGNITIDDKTISLQNNTGMFNPCKEATQITLLNTPASYIGDTKNIFPNLSRLTITNVEVIGSAVTLPESITELTLVNVTIEQNILERWLNNPASILKYLSLNGSTTLPAKHKTKNVDMCLRESCRELQYLRITGDTVFLLIDETVCDNLTSLHISAKTFTSNMSCRCIQDLFLDCEYVIINFKTYSSSNAYGTLIFDLMKNVKSLTVKALPLKLPTSLKSLKISGRVDPKHRPYIEGLNLESVDVQYYDYARKDQPNHILNTLNDDCLLMLLNCLTIQDCISFAATHARIHRLATRYRVCRLDNESLKILQANPDFYHQVTPFVRELSLSDLSEKEVIEILPLFTGLKNLHLDRITFSEEVIAVFPTELEILTSTEPSKVIDMRALRNYIRKLKHLRKINLANIIQCHFIYDIVLGNHDTLEDVTLTMSNVDWMRQRIWPVLESMPRLKQMTIKRFQSYGSNQEYTTKEVADMEKAFSRIGKPLQRLTIDHWKSGMMFMINGENFPRLQELVLRFDSGIRMTNAGVQALCSLKQLRKLKIDYAINLSNADLIQLILSLPNLVELRIPELMTFNDVRDLMKSVEGKSDLFTLDSTSDAIYIVRA